MHYDAVIFSFISFFCVLFCLLVLLSAYSFPFAAHIRMCVSVCVSVSDVGSLRCCCYYSLLHAANRRDFHHCVIGQQQSGLQFGFVQLAAQKN